MGNSAEPDARAFSGVRPLTGFDVCGDPGDAPVQTDLFLFPTVNLPTDHQAGTPILLTRGEARIERLAAAPYLQLELRFPRAAGWLEVYHEDRLIDRAELMQGWQHSAVELKDVPVAAELTLVFRSDADADALEVLIRSIHLSDSWGRGQRRRLKCHHPFSLFAAFDDFSVYPCCARQWLKGDQRAGSTTDQSLAELWNGPVYQRMRGEFLAGDYSRSCREDVCPMLQAGGQASEPPPAAIAAINEGRTVVDYGPLRMYHDIDRGCNLECVMCRDEKILPNAAKVKQAIGDLKEAVQLGSLEQVWFSGAGEILIMADVVRLLESDTFSSAGVEVAFITNLTHLNDKLWNRIRHNSFANVTISADGASSAIYEKIRIGAKWPVVEKNMRFLARLRHSGEVRSITWNYTVQKDNVADIGRAVSLARELGFDTIRLIAQLGSLSRTNGNMFEDHDLEALDALHDELVRVDAFDDPRVVTSELGVGGQAYRSFQGRLELAQHIFERRGFVGDSKRALPRKEWQKCLRLMIGLKSDLEEGKMSAPGSLSPEQRDFLQRFARSAELDSGIVARLWTTVRPPESPLRGSRALADWARQLGAAMASEGKKAA
ncbi:MAG TPA: radical SAM protein [Allosphingosinicella sp.]|jgi:hypothetical protein